jgi:23S rRNA pseudouridine1911/1915/1917 synthase
MPEIRLTVEDEYSGGIRLDRYCASRPGAITRSRLKNGAIDIRVNDQKAKLSRIVRNGDRIVISWEDSGTEDIFPENIPLDILYEDGDITVIDKCQGMVTHPGAGNWSGTLVHALLWHWKRESPVGNPRPGIVHRLDRDTSGVIITARNPETEAYLQGEFRHRRVRKTYIAILAGTPKNPEGEVKTHLIRDPKNRKRFTWTDNPERGKFSHTSYRVVKRYGPYSLVVFSLHTGRTHQLRVHSKLLGCPILGDPVYGKKDRLFPDATLMLHARTLLICLPGDEKATRFSAAVPLRFRMAIKKLRELYPS